ncbi:hypothetical protein BC629DRAFT_1443896 [Irpex lacteus]|nr:hypothetical protein BC629DRAFT_1443896 [Irpex lacteus]
MSSQSDATWTGLGILSFLPPELRLMMGPYAENLIQAPDSSPSRFAQAPNLGRKAGHSSLDTTDVVRDTIDAHHQTPTPLRVPTTFAGTVLRDMETVSRIWTMQNQPTVKDARSEISDAVPVDVNVDQLDEKWLHCPGPNRFMKNHAHAAYASDKQIRNLNRGNYAQDPKFIPTCQIPAVPGKSETDTPSDMKSTLQVVLGFCQNRMFIAGHVLPFEAPTHVQRKPPYTTDETRHATASLPHSHNLSSIIATVSFCDHDEWLRVPPACHVTYGLMPAAACASVLPLSLGREYEAADECVMIEEQALPDIPTSNAQQQPSVFVNLNTYQYIWDTTLSHPSLKLQASHYPFKHTFKFDELLLLTDTQFSFTFASYSEFDDSMSSRASPPVPALLFIGKLRILKFVEGGQHVLAGTIDPVLAGLRVTNPRTRSSQNSASQSYQTYTLVPAVVAQLFVVTRHWGFSGGESPTTRLGMSMSKFSTTRKSTGEYRERRTYSEPARPPARPPDRRRLPFPPSLLVSLLASYSNSVYISFAKELLPYKRLELQNVANFSASGSEPFLSAVVGLLTCFKRGRRVPDRAARDILICEAIGPPQSLFCHQQAASAWTCGLGNCIGDPEHSEGIIQHCDERTCGLGVSQSVRVGKGQRAHISARIPTMGIGWISTISIRYPFDTHF